jgi:ligand-binding sensor domain-containing protein
MKKFYLTAIIILMLGTSSLVKAQFTNYSAGNSSLPSDYVCGGVAVDNNNNVWAGTDAGVAKFDGSTWTIFTTTNGLPVNIISCIAVDSVNNIWIGTDGDGVAKYNGSTWTTYAYADGLCDNGIHYMACDNDGIMWFGSWGGGISKFDGTTWTNYTDSNGWPSDGGVMASVYYISVDASNNKWFGTDLGLVKYDNTTFTTINQTTTPNLQNNYITAVKIDANNNKWLGVQYKGIAKLNSSSIWVANFDTLNGLCNNNIQDIKTDSDGNIWLGEYTMYGSLVIGGITKFDGTTGSGISYTESDGLLNEQVFRIDLDNNDNVWIATGGGLFKYTAPSGIEESNNNLLLNIYPNPVHDYLNIIGDIRSGNAEISDITGRVISSQQISSPVKINTESLINGVYFIKITENEKIYNGRFIKE